MEAQLEPQIGAFVLESLTTGMYADPLDSLREYVQNSFDSIREAERDGRLQTGAGRIEVFIEQEKHRFRIKDNGKGIPAQAAIAKLLNVGMSSKDLEQDAGFRGIGRLAGLAYCAKLHFRTAASNENRQTHLCFDAAGIRSAISPRNQNPNTLAEVLRQNVKWTIEERTGKASFLEVELEEVNDEGQAFLNWSSIESYLSQVAPLGFNTQGFCLSERIYSVLDKKNFILPTVDLVIKAPISRQIHKPYLSQDYKTKRDSYPIPIKDVEVYVPQCSSEYPSFWAWHAVTTAPGAFADDRVAGFRIRSSNIALGGPELATALFREISPSNDRFNYYFMGEIHLLDKTVIPNARRDGIEDTQRWREIKEEIKEYFRLRCEEVREKSKIRNLDVNKLTAPIEKDLELLSKRLHSGFASKDERNKLVERLVDRDEKLARALEDEGRTARDRERLAAYKKRIEDAQEEVKNAKYTAQNLRSSLDKKQRKVVAEILAILYDNLTANEFERLQTLILKKYQIPQGEV